MRPHRRQSRRKATAIITGIPPEDIIQALNGPPSDPAAQDEAELDESAFTRRLRELVDEWLETGRRSDGSESPGERDLFEAAGALRAVEKCLAENPARLVHTWSVLGSGPNVSVQIGMRPVPPSHLFGYPAPPFNIFAPTVSAKITTKPAPRQRDTADRLFTDLILSDWQNSLCKCRYAHCGRYFLKEKLRRSYRRGTFCGPKHQGHASATVYTNSFRTRAKPVLIEMAAWLLFRKGITNSQWQDDNGQKLWLAGAVSKEIRRQRLNGKPLSDYRKKVTVKWVSQNELAIEEKRASLFDHREA